jgi:signal peptidase I
MRVPPGSGLEGFLRHAREAASLGAFLLVAMAARSSLADHYVIPSASMEPTLGIGDRIVVDKRAYGLRLPFTLHVIAGSHVPERGDVVVFDSPVDGKPWVKRVVAVPGDTVQVRGGVVRVDGHDLPRAGRGTVACETLGGRLHQVDAANGDGPDQPPLEVPPGHLFVMGDNRGNSYDSRGWGLLPQANVLGRAAAIYWTSGEGPRWSSLSDDDCPGG